MTTENTDLTNQIIAREKAALDKWFKGDTSGYLNLWSQTDFSYFDSFKAKRVDSYAEIKDFVLANVEGKLYADSYDFETPRVQAVDDMAVLTYQLFAKTTLNDMRYNCIEVFKRVDDDWQVIHSTWSVIRPMDMAFDRDKPLV
ncbi:nuclear transport factor 2 family protein [Levilactobacillus tangyuanensis]|uniref:Nuclear transport factor 2 family protein n=1 Tax=Levilactobacillus tangyuanensis TaxID=2486021 RepID=A0ABW1TLQ1_9LACO|nr:nuclear transport factor 2 family protein [Levilactobacillus tangyuanensis]